MNPNSFRPRRKPPWRAIAITFITLFAVFMFLCSGLSFPIVGGASRDLRRSIQDDFGVALPPSAVVQNGARVAQLDVSYFYVVQVASQDLQPFIDSIRAAARSGQRLKDLTQFQVLGPKPPSWFDPMKAADLVMFETHLHQPWCWRWGYSPSTGRIYIYRISF